MIWDCFQSCLVDPKTRVWLRRASQLSKRCGFPGQVSSRSKLSANRIIRGRWNESAAVGVTTGPICLLMPPWCTKIPILTILRLFASISLVERSVICLELTRAYIVGRWQWQGMLDTWPFVPRESAEVGTEAETIAEATVCAWMWQSFHRSPERRITNVAADKHFSDAASPQRW